MATERGQNAFYLKIKTMNFFSLLKVFPIKAPSGTSSDFIYFKLK